MRANCIYIAWTPPGTPRSGRALNRRFLRGPGRRRTHRLLRHRRSRGAGSLYGALRRFVRSPLRALGSARDAARSCWGALQYLLKRRIRSDPTLAFGAATDHSVMRRQVYQSANLLSCLLHLRRCCQVPTREACKYRRAEDLRNPRDRARRREGRADRADPMRSITCRAGQGTRVVW